jgi:hypothetical protein
MATGRAAKPRATPAEPASGPRSARALVRWRAAPGLGAQATTTVPPDHLAAHINVSPVVASTAAEGSGERTVESEIDALQLGL